MAFKSDFDESGWVTMQEMERIEFHGGVYVVYKYQETPRSESSIVIKVLHTIKSESDLWAYVESRTKAMNELLGFVNPNESLQVTLTFNTPLEPVDFQSLCRDYLEKPNLYAILLKNETSGSLGAVSSGPNPLDPSFVKDFTYLKEGFTLVGIIASEGLLKAGMVKTLQSDSRVLLVDPVEDLTARALVEKHLATGLYVGGGVWEILFSSKMWSEYAKLKYGVTWVLDSGVFEPEVGTYSVDIDELLRNPAKYHRYRIHVFGTVSHLGLVGGPYFMLDEKLRVCFIHDEITVDISQFNNGDYVSVIGRF